MIGLHEPEDEIIPGYQLIAPIGSGGFGEVWKCVAPGGLHKAIKFVVGNLNTKDGDSAKAEQELKALSRVREVRHPFVLTNERIDNVDGELVIVMELADKSLHDCLADHHRDGQPGIPRDTLLRYLGDAAEGLDYLIDKHNLQHLDVKPKNLFLVADRVKVADFGLVKHLERHSSSGLMGGVTPVYAAPETFTNKISKHSDQYSLAVVYVELLTGERPFNGKNIRTLAIQHMTEKPDLSRLPADDRPIVAKALSKNPDDRFPSCTAFIRALQGKSSDHPITVRTPNPLTSTPPPTTNLTQPLLTPLPDASSPPVTATRLEIGVLRPAILIGIGSFGRRALQEIRCRLLDRLGDLGQVPSFRFLYLDADPAGASRAQSNDSDAAMVPEQILHLPLQPVTAYRRKHLEPIVEWLPREKLYAIPRSLSPEGSRALNRLAFCDHYLKVSTRLKNEIHIATHPESIKQSADQTGLTPRAKVPNVYVFVGGTGGGSGMLVDVGHAVRRILNKYNMPEAAVNAFLYCGAPDDPDTPELEQANLYATLTELNHYADPDVTFTATYSGDTGPKIEGRGLPFNATYLLAMNQRSNSSLRDTLSHLAGYITQELTTPFGTGVEEMRTRKAPLGRTPFRSFGTFALWFPRGLLLRTAARQLCLELLQQWATNYSGSLQEVLALTQNINTDPRLSTEAVQQFILQECQRSPSGNPMEMIGKWYLSIIEQIDQAARRNEGANWAVACWDQAKDLMGLEPTRPADSTFRRGRFSRSLDQGLVNAAEAWMNELQELLRPMMELHGPRLMAIRESLERLMSAFDAAAANLEQKSDLLAEATNRAKVGVATALEACQGESSGFQLFGGRGSRALRTFAEKVKVFIDARVHQDLVSVAAQFYRRLAIKLADRHQDVLVATGHIGQLVGTMTTRMQRTSEASDASDEGMQTTLRMTNVMKIVLPEGDSDLDSAANRVIATLSDADRARLYELLDRLVIEPRGGLMALCKSSTDLTASLVSPLVEQTTAFLTDRVPNQDVTQVEFNHPESKSGGLPQRIANYLKLAASPLNGPSDEERTFALVPSTVPGCDYARQVKLQAPKAVIVTVQGSGTDMMFCRELGQLRPIDIAKLMEPCMDGYLRLCEKPDHSPHARFDIAQWVPLVDR